jgi:hypothetical protein
MDKKILLDSYIFNTTIDEYFADTDKKAILQLVYEYYSKLDDCEDIKEFMTLISWDDFEIINGASVIDTFEKYEKWYEEIKKSMFNKKHVVEKLEIGKSLEDSYTVSIDMNFTGNSWTPGHARSKDIHVTGKIEWKVSRDSESNKMKINRYSISEKE